MRVDNSTGKLLESCDHNYPEPYLKEQFSYKFNFHSVTMPPCLLTLQLLTINLDLKFLDTPNLLGSYIS